MSVNSTFLSGRELYEMCSLINCQVSSELITGVDSLALGSKRKKTRETGIPVVLR